MPINLACRYYHFILLFGALIRVDVNAHMAFKRTWNCVKYILRAFLFVLATVLVIQIVDKLNKKWQLRSSFFVVVVIVAFFLLLSSLANICNNAKQSKLSVHIWVRQCVHIFCVCLCPYQSFWYSLHVQIKNEILIEKRLKTVFSHFYLHSLFILSFPIFLFYFSFLSFFISLFLSLSFSFFLFLSLYPHRNKRRLKRPIMVLFTHRFYRFFPKLQNGVLDLNFFFYLKREAWSSRISRDFRFLNIWKLE